MYLKKYATATHFYIPIVKRGVVDFAVSADWTPAAGDVKVSIDGAAAGNVTNLPTAITMGNTAMWDFSMTAGEMTGAQIMISVADAATKAVEDQMIIALTYGNASAAMPFDLGTASTAQTGDNYARLGAPAGASVSADIAAVKVDTAAVKVQTDKLAFTVANQVDCNVLDWKSSAAPAMTGDAFARLGAPAGASVSADIAAVKTDTAAIKLQTDKLTFTVANQIDANVLDWKSAVAPAMTGDAFARLGAPAGASVSADVAAIFARIGAPAGASIAADIAAVSTGALTATSLRAAIGMASANLDTQLAEIEGETDDIAAIKAKTDNLPSDPADESLIIAATDSIMTRIGAPVGASISADIAEVEADLDTVPADVWSHVVEGAFTAQDYARLMAAALLGKVSGMESLAPIFRDPDDTVDRITASVDRDGNRLTIVLNAA